ncbi:amino acid ABC transporter permease [Neosynechococcus sphagnicola]|uniref:amino acid ABC transporter permease n=1 Tax=Neosynechococcus sphagnicola TaxID=1501145 RepID=UPI00195528F5|nr:amino acid ABC transporter permease [Neosynechococcus sphagnicola]
MRGALNTLIYCGLSFPIAVFLGLVLAAMSSSNSIWLRVPSRMFIEAARCTPIITQVLLLYYGVGAVLLSFNLSTFANAWVAGVISLALNYAAYEAEVFRAGFLGVDPGQTEAALSLGMTPEQSFLKVKLPQAVPLVIPPLVNDFIYMLKDSAIVSVISGSELTSVLQSWSIRNSSDPLPLYVLALVLYLLMSLPIAYIGRTFEQKLRAAM